MGGDMRVKFKDGNIIGLERRKSAFEAMTYDGLLAERNFMRSEKARVQFAIEAVSEIDPRGMWTEPVEMVESLEQMEIACQMAIEVCERELIRRNGGSK